MNHTSRIIAPFFIVFAAFLWALDGVVLRPSLYSLPVTLVVFLEHFLGVLVMLPLAIQAFKESKRLSARQWWVFVLVAVFGGVMGTLFITKALFYVNYIQLSVVLLIQKLQPVFALILARVLLKERLPKGFFVWALCAIVATYFLTFPGLRPDLTAGGAPLLAALFALGAAFSWGASTVLSKKGLQSVSFQTATFLRFFITSVILAVMVAATGSYQELSRVTNTQWHVFILIVFSSGAAAMLVYYFGLRKVKASVATICELFFPVSAVFLEYLIRGTVLTPLQIIAAVVILFSMYNVSVISSHSK